MTEKKKRGRPRKNVLDQAVAIPYTRSTSDDPKEQAINDLIEIGRSVTEFSDNGIRRIDPLSPEAEVALYNAEHPDQFTEVKTVKYPKDWDTMSKTDKLAWYTKSKIK